MSARGKARKRALDILYEADIRGIPALEVLESQVTRRSEDGDPELNVYVSEIVHGVVEHGEYIDEVISTYSLGWTLPRMPAVDRSILRLACYEVLWNDDVPDAVVISEAVKMAQSLSTDESSTFVNGLLARISEVKSRLTTQ
ncbi:MAG: transcription antitermination factor NusB [Actinobacteria bacterium]|nr:MAG: transcription antitermination factor NusB [Actinomycetota bacterium]